jgi:predicted PurR-regulated permease PerM
MSTAAAIEHARQVMDPPTTPRRPGVAERNEAGHAGRGPAAGDDAALLAAPRWLRELGTSAWLLVGIALLTVAAVWLLSLTQTIVMPLIAAGVIAAVTSPIVVWLERRGVARGLAAALVLIAMALIATSILLAIVGGVLGQADELSGDLSAAADKLARGLRDLGVTEGEAADARDDLTGAVGKAVPALLAGVVGGISALSSLAFFLALTALSLFFLLKDGPAIRAWAEAHSSVPAPVARLITERSLRSLRGYFVGVTAIAAFNAVVIGGGALLLGVPNPGTIAIVNFCGAYIPYLGAWGAGGFTVLIALGGAGSDVAIAMAVVCLLANGLLQQMVQPIAYGAALGIHPLAVLIVTIAGGSLFGAAGLILAPPLTSAITGIAADLREGRTAAGQGGRRAAPPATP